MVNLWKRLQQFLGDKASKRRLFLYFLITLIFFGIFCKPDYATDTYAYASGDFSEIVNNFLRCGRIFTAGIYTLLRLIHIDIRIVNFACFLIAIISLTLALFILEKLLRKNFLKDPVWSFLLPLIILVNPLIIEFFLFIEKGIMCFSILLCVLSSYYYCTYLTSRRRSDLLKVLCLNLFATFWYQGTVGVFIILATLVTCLKSKTWANFFKDTLLSVFLYAIGPLLNVLMIKLFFSYGRAGGGLQIIASSRIVLDNIGKMFNLFNVIPPFVFWGYLGLIFGAWLYYQIKHRRLTLLPFVQILYLSLVVLLAAIAPQIALQPEGVWLAPRSTYPFATILGVIMVVLFYTAPQFLAAGFWRNSALFLTLLLIGIQLFNFQQLAHDHYSIAEIDHLRAKEIGRQIWLYEQEHNTTITKIMPAQDQHITYSYPGIAILGDSNISAFNTNWSDVTNLSYWNRRQFTRVDPTSEWQNYCNSHDWQYLNTEQLEFSGDTLKICWY